MSEGLLERLDEQELEPRPQRAPSPPEDSRSWEGLVKGYDVVALMLVAVLWAYIAPLAALPQSGCPGEGCWRYCGFIVLYIGVLTFFLPFLAVVLVRCCSTRVHRLAVRDSVFRRYIARRTQSFAILAMGMTWSVANSTLVYNVEAQAAYDMSGDKTSDDAAISQRDPRTQRMPLAGLALGISLGYSVLAVLSITSISSLCKCGICLMRCCGCSWTDSTYLIELGMLLQDNWYYVVGYSWESVFTYVLYATVDTTRGHALFLLFLAVLRVFVITALFTYSANRLIPFDPSDADASAADTGCRLRLLLFRSHVVVVVVALMDIPTYFVTVYLADERVAGIGAQLQVLLLYAFALLALVLLTAVDVHLGRIQPQTKRVFFCREVSQWLLAFLIWIPWQKTTAALASKIDGLTRNPGAVVVFQVFFGILLTVFVALGSGVLHGMASSDWQESRSSYNTRSRRSTQEGVSLGSFDTPYERLTPGGTDPADDEEYEHTGKPSLTPDHGGKEISKAVNPSSREGEADLEQGQEGVQRNPKPPSHEIGTNVNRAVVKGGLNPHHSSSSGNARADPDALVFVPGMTGNCGEPHEGVVPDQTPRQDEVPATRSDYLRSENEGGGGRGGGEETPF